MRNVIASILVILAALAMAVLGTVGAFGLFLVVPVALSSTALALALVELFGTKDRGRKDGQVRLHISATDPVDQHHGRARHLRIRDAHMLGN